MDTYQVQLLLDAVRLGTACVLFFLLLPRVLFRGIHAAGDNQPYSGYWSGMVLAGTLYVGLVHLLTLLGIYDPVILLGLVLALAAVRVGLRLRGAASIRTYADLLRFIENSNWFASIERFVRQRMGRPPAAWIGSLALVALLLAAAVIRLEPMWHTASPFSLAFYDVLQDVKSMQVSLVYHHDGFEERGLHGLALAFHAFSQVNEATIVRLLGALSALLLVYSIYQVTRGTTGNRAAAFVAASLFGIAGISLLPVGIESQVEANPTLLATAFALPALFFGGYYLHRGERYLLSLCTAALLTCLLTRVSVAAVAGVLLSVLAGGMWLFSSGRLWKRRAAHLLGMGMTLELVAWGGGGAMQQALQPTDPYAVSHFEVVANSLPPLEAQAPTAATGVLVWSAVGVLGLAACFGRDRLRRTTCLACGVACAFLYTLWQSPAVLDALDIEAAIPALLLAALLCVAAGLAWATVSATARPLVQRFMNPQVKNRAIRLSVACLALGGSSWLAIPLPQFEGGAVEPPGYARAFNLVQDISTPYRWTVVGHLGLKVRAQNEGYYMSYEHFVSQYDPATYEHRGDDAIPTRDVFVFVDKQPQQALLRDELRPPSADVTAQIQQWCQTYAARSNDISVFYDDDAVRVYRIARHGASAAPPPAHPLQQLEESTPPAE